VKKETLRINDSDLHENVLLFAISSSESDIRICRLINDILHINLVLTENLEIINKNRTLAFRRFMWESHEEIEKYVLVVNKGSGSAIFQELTKIDFLLFITTESPKGHIEEAMQLVRNLPEISAIYKVDPRSLKNFNRIHF
jgi:hypothetical protein